jgi:hypothetical protein
VLVGEATALLLGLGQVDVEQGIEVPRRLPDVDQHRQRHGVGGVRRESHLDPIPVAVTAGVEVGDLGDPTGPPPGVSLQAGQLQHPGGHHGARAGIHHGVG